MNVTSKISVDLTRPNIGSRVNAVQGDGNTRLVEITLLSGGQPWTPPEGVEAAIAYMQPGGTKGLYNKLADDTAAISMAGNVATIILAPQMLTASGTVQASLVFNDAQLNRLTTFPFSVSVASNPSAGAQKVEDYLRLQWLEDKLDKYLRKAADSGAFDGAPGVPGKTPVYGVDYGTPEQIADVAKKAAGILAGDIQKISDDKVDKVEGKGLSTHDYDDADKAKVDAIPEDPKYTDTVYDDTEVKKGLSQIKDDLKQLHDELGDVANIVQSENLFDKNSANNLYDKYVTYNGGIANASGYFTSALIYLEAGTYTYRTRSSTYSDVDKVPTYTKDGTFLAFITGTISNEDYVTFTISEPTYIRLKSMTASVNELMLVKGSEYPTEYIPYYYRKVLGENIDTTENVVKSLETLNISNPLYGKKISANGDSICYGNGYLGGYAKIISDRNNMQYENVAVGGGTITAETYSDSTARHWVSRSIDDMANDADYIIIEGGVNDAALSVPLGTITSGYNASFDDTTFYGALESTFKQLITKYIGKKFGFIIVHRMVAGMESKGAYYNAIIECSSKWSVPVLDLSKEVPPFNWFRNSEEFDAIRNEYTTAGDGWHPTEKCYREYYVPKIEAWLKGL